MASGSGTDSAFGIVGQTGSGALDGIGWVYNPALQKPVPIDQDLLWLQDQM